LFIDGPTRQDVAKAHHERTEREKDEMYEKIAQQLAFIADNYGMELTASAATATAASSRVTSSSDEATGGGRGNRSSGQLCHFMLNESKKLSKIICCLG
jgi:hypothetical protein